MPPLIQTASTALPTNQVIELYEMVCVRHGLMVVGPTGGGKSCAIRALADALSALKAKGCKGTRFERVDTCHLNPKVPATAISL
jgi:dynein heavy chain, axonemal